MKVSFRTLVIASACSAAVSVGAGTRELRAQAMPGVSAPTTAVIARVRIMADAGDGERARTLLDSLVNAVPRESADAGEALFWRASLSDQSASAERDWKQLVVEVPLSPRVPEALLRLSELDMLHNNTLIARQHAQRLMRDFPDAPQRMRGMVVLAQSYFTDNDAPRACGVLTALRKDAPLSAVEVRMQADEMQQQCRGVREVAMGAAPDATPQSAPIVAPLPVILPSPASPVNAAGRGAKPPVAAAETTPPKPTARDIAADRAAKAQAAKDAAAKAQAEKDSIAQAALDRAQEVKDSIALDKITRVQTDKENAAREAVAKAQNAKDLAAAKAQAAKDAAAAKELATKAEEAPAIPVSAVGRWTIQVAAYDTKADAEALVKKLNTKNLPAHTVGAKKPFRVQVGRFETRADAAAALAIMKTKGQNGFISEWLKK